MEYGNLNPASKSLVRGGITKSRLNRNHYVITLLNEGSRAGLLTREAIYRIQHDFMGILRALIGRYTQGESSSVSTETAEQLMSSIMYATDAYLFSLDQPDKAIWYLKTLDIGDLYERGVESVRQCFEQTKMMYSDIRIHTMVFPVEAYQMTIEESLPLFFRKYELIFDAPNTMTSIDYPLAIDDMKLQGVFYIKQYLERLKMEQTFCASFDPEAIISVLADYGRTCRFDYRIELFNIFELLMNQSVFSILSGGGATHITISQNRYERLAQQFRDLTESGVRSAVSYAVERMKQELRIVQPLDAYIDDCKENLVKRVTNAASHDSLSNFIIKEREAIVKPIILSFGAEDAMSDVQLRRHIDAVMRCVGEEEKISMILKYFKSFRDYLDLLEADCLYDGEFNALFQRFCNIELAVLARVAFYEELREANSLSEIVRMKNNYPQEWQRQFGLFLQGKSEGQLDDLARLLQQVDEEQLRFY